MKSHLMAALAATALLAPASLPAQATRPAAATKPAAAAAAATKPAAEAATSAHDDIMKAARNPGKFEFRANNEVFNAVGTFENWAITDMYLPEDGDWSKGRVELTFQTSTVKANADGLTNHLKQDDMLKAEAFPAIKVVIHDAKAKADDPNAFDAQATISLIGVEKTIPVTFQRNPENHQHIIGSATVDRSMFGVYSPYEEGNPRSVKNAVSVAVDMKLPDAHAFMAAKKAMEMGKGGAATAAATMPAAMPASRPAAK
mgnify:CR=1 FL=1